MLGEPHPEEMNRYENNDSDENAIKDIRLDRQKTYPSGLSRFHRRRGDKIEKVGHQLALHRAESQARHDMSLHQAKKNQRWDQCEGSGGSHLPPIGSRYRHELG